VLLYLFASALPIKELQIFLEVMIAVSSSDEG
jgi:hypothetical protein